LSSEFLLSWKKVAWYNLDTIFHELTQEKPNFYDLKQSEQQRLFKEKALQIASENTINSPSLI
jgi:hypothetical protein